METIQKIRSAFNLINLRKEVESLMKYNDLHMEDIVEIGGPSYIYDGTTEEFFDMLEYYYSGNPRVNALMFDIRFEDGSRIYTEVDTDYNMVLASTPKWTRITTWSSSNTRCLPSIAKKSISGIRSLPKWNEKSPGLSTARIPSTSRKSSGSFVFPQSV